MEHDNAFMTAAGVKDLRQLLLPFFVNGTDRRSFRLFVGLLVSSVFVALGLSAWTIVLVNGVLSSALPADWLTGLSVMRSFVDWGLSSAALTWISGLAVLASAVLVWFCRGMTRRRQGAWLYVVGAFWLLLIANAMLVLFSFFLKDLTDAFVDKKLAEARRSLIQVLVFLLALAPVIFAYSYVSKSLANYWREAMSLRFLGGYLGDRYFYEISSSGGGLGVVVDNPDQRISQDIEKFTTQTSELFFRLVMSVTSAFSFAFVLISINAWILLFVVIYASVSSGLIAFIGRKLVRLNYVQLKLDADFRYALVRVRDNAESIAFYSGEKGEWTRSVRSLLAAIKNQYRVIRLGAVVNSLSQVYQNMGFIVPYVLLWSVYFKGEIQFGVFTQVSQALAVVMGAFSFIVENFNELAGLLSNTRRLQELGHGFDQQSVDFESGPPLDNTTSTASSTLLLPERMVQVEEVTLRIPAAERTLVRNLSLNLDQTSRLLIVGPSGCGKTSLLRLFCGLWPAATGTVASRGLQDGLMFVPQKPYVFPGSLRDQLLYPDANQMLGLDKIQNLMESVSLTSVFDHAESADEQVDWPRVLSVGEQQRIAFARVLLAEARFVLLDESTSALDLATERAAYRLLREAGTGFVSVGHRSSLLEYHDSVLELDREGGWRLIDARDYVFA
ncbi:xenobiotic ABC transporter/ ATPase component [Synechococcus sp. A18-25c]|nr:xenobiotic ABC transporter/ ATPase component [Synechococcus sp. A18-25c]